VSDGLGGSVDDVRWVGLGKAQMLHAKEQAMLFA
jgi:hypothetical protein